jgi:hypothetical protein
MLATFPKNVNGKNIYNSSKIINKKIIIVKERGYLGELESVKWVVLDLRGPYSSHPYPPSGSYIGTPK